MKWCHGLNEAPPAHLVDRALNYELSEVTTGEWQLPVGADLRYLIFILENNVFHPLACTYNIHLRPSADTGHLIIGQSIWPRGYFGDVPRETESSGD